MSSVQGYVIFPAAVHAKQTKVYTLPVNDPSRKYRISKSGFWGLKGISCGRTSVGNRLRLHNVKVVRCSFSSSSDGNGSMAENFNENEADYVNSSVTEAVEVKSSSDGFMIKMKDGRHLRCAHNNPHAGRLPDYAPHPAIVLKMEDGTGLLFPIIVLEMPSALLMAALHNVQIARPTMYHVVMEMIEKMGYEVPIQVNKDLAYSDGMRIIESAKLFPGSSSDGFLLTELDRPSGQPCSETKEFDLLRNMLIAAIEERYRDAAQWRDKLTQFRSKMNWA